MLADAAGAIAIRDLLSRSYYKTLLLPWTWRSARVEPAAAKEPPAADQSRLPATFEARPAPPQLAHAAPDAVPEGRWAEAFGTRWPPPGGRVVPGTVAAIAAIRASASRSRRPPRTARATSRATGSRRSRSRRAQAGRRGRDDQRGGRKRSSAGARGRAGCGRCRARGDRQLPLPRSARRSPLRRPSIRRRPGSRSPTWAPARGRRRSSPSPSPSRPTGYHGPRYRPTLDSPVDGPAGSRSPRRCSSSIALAGRHRRAEPAAVRAGRRRDHR